MAWKTLVGIGIAFVVLMFGTVLVFEAFDWRHGVFLGATMRPFVITMAPVWAVAIAAARVLLRGNRN